MESWKYTHTGLEIFPANIFLWREGSLHVCLLKKKCKKKGHKYFILYSFYLFSLLFYFFLQAIQYSKNKTDLSRKTDGTVFDNTLKRKRVETDENDDEEEPW